MQQPEPLEPRGDRPRGPRATRDDEAYNEIPSPTRNVESDVESDGGNVSIKLLAYQGGQRRQAWLAAVEARMPHVLNTTLNEAREALTEMDAVRVPRNMRDADQELDAALIESLINPKANPANEGLSIFNKVNALKTIGRSGVRAILAIENLVHRNTAESRNASMQELMGLRVSNNSLEGVSDFLTRFRDLRARSACDDEWTLGLLRTKLLGYSNQGHPVR